METASDHVFSQVQIFMQHAGDQIAYESDAPPPADMNAYLKVFDGALSFPDTGWREIMLDTGFAYDGASSLEIVFMNKSGSSSSDKPYFAYKSDLAHDRMVRHFGETNAIFLEDGARLELATDVSSSQL